GNLPVQLHAPEIVGIVRETGRCQAIPLGPAFPALVHREEEQAILQDRAGRPRIGLVPGAAIAAVDGMHSVIAVITVLASRLPRRRLGGDLGTGLELVAARPGDGIDDTTGAAAEFRRVTAGFDLEFL